MNFKSFSFNPDVAAGAEKAGYITATPIQEKAIPEVMNGRDVMGLAQTGTGKTAAFALPILNRLIDGPRGKIKALVIAPTRELAEQIHRAMETLGWKTGLRSAVVYGGVGINPQIQALRRADIVVCCPGRLLDHIGRRTIDLSRLEVLVVDEADQMFDMGFFPDIRRILSHVPSKTRQTLLFSATMPQEIRRLANDILHNPVTVQIGIVAPAKTVKHALFPVAHHLKTPMLIKLLGQVGDGSVLVFTRTKFRAKSLDKKLQRAGYRSTSIQGNLSQNRRQAALKSFKAGEFQIMVATDIAARGIDISNISHVINYDMPSTADAYIHRIGRTGRAECQGEAFTLVTGEDAAMVKAINRAIGSCVEQRTFEDFNYKTSPPSQGKQGDQANRFKPTGRKPERRKYTSRKKSTDGNGSNGGKRNSSRKNAPKSNGAENGGHGQNKSGNSGQHAPGAFFCMSPKNTQNRANANRA